MKYAQRWRQTTIANQILSTSTALMTLGTLFLFVAALFQYFTARDQLAQMREQTAVMRDEVKAANRVADIAADQSQAIKDSAVAAKRQADASLIQANVSERMAKQNEALIASAEIQANTSRIAAAAANKSAGIAVVGMLPKIHASYAMGTFEPDKEIVIRVRIENRGDTSALNVVSEMGIVRFNLPLRGPTKKPTLAVLPSVTTLAPNAAFDQVITAKKFEVAEFKALTEAGTRALRLWVWGRYDDEFGGRNRPFRFCWAYDTDARQLAHCTEDQYAEVEKPN